ncbi:two-component regulator propeller domain-containing protein [Labilibaculum sp.]|uniref:sensor histidine kinase n=1 Tax=Labilibaculum sp. TaxID=2060723 RepID=UPI00356A80A5
MEKKHMNRILLVFLILLISWQGFAQDNRFINFKLDDGLAQNYVYTISQDSLGNLWIGTGNGLSKYDGYSFQNFSEQDSLGGNFITSSLNTKNGLWFGHLNGKVSFYDGKNFTYYSNTNSSIVDLEKDVNSNIWVASQNKEFIKFKNEKSKAELYSNTLLQPVFTFKFIDDNRLLVGTSNGLCLCAISSDNRIKLVSEISEIPKNKIVDILQSKSKECFYILTENDGLFRLEQSESKFTVRKIPEAKEISKAQKLYEDKSGSLWITSLNSGLLKLIFSNNKSIKIEKYDEQNGLHTNAIKTIFEDREGNIWIGKYGEGLSRLVPLANSFLSFDEEKYSNSIHSICIVNEYKWIGTAKELLKVDLHSNKVVKVYDVNGNLENEKINALSDWKGKELWIGTERSGIFRLNYQTGKIKAQFLRLGNLEKSINSIITDNEFVWIATQKGLCRFSPETNNKKWFTMQEEGLPHNSVNYLLKDQQNRIWIGTLSNTLSYIKNDELIHFSLAAKSKLLNITSMVEDPKGSIWVGTQGNGVYLVNEDSTLNINYQHGLLSDYCYSMNSDGKRLWVTHRGGISQIRLADYYINTMQKNAGILSSTEFNKNSTAKGSNNVLYFGSNQGVYSYDISKEANNEVAPSLEVSFLQVDGEEYDYTNDLILPAGQYKIKLGFKGISMNEPEKIKYQYFLEGYEHDWSKPDNGRSVEYKHLSSGNYVFHLQAVNGIGVESLQVLDFKIKIKYPIWQKKWFQLLSLFCFLLVIYIFIVLREQNLKRIQRKLIQNLDDKTREVIAKEEVIKERKRTEKELIKAKDKAEESDRLKTAFLSNMSHEIRTPLNAIVGFSTMLQEPEIPTNSKERYLSILRSNTDDLLSLIDDIMDISSIEAGLLKIKHIECNPHTFLSELFTVHSKKMAELNNTTVQLNYLEKDIDLVIYSDPLRVKQILSNLISNAIKFTEKGSIDFGIESVKDGFVKFYVKDTGIGISESEKNVIFERFRKEHREVRTKLYRGAGLGLAISKSMVNLLGGEIGVESVVGEGACFYFTLPIEN